MLNCIDNSGATLVECVAKLRVKKRNAQIGMPAWSKGKNVTGRGALTAGKVIASSLSCRKPVR